MMFSQLDQFLLVTWEVKKRSNNLSQFRLNGRVLNSVFGYHCFSTQAPLLTIATAVGTGKTRVHKMLKHPFKIRLKSELNVEEDCGFVKPLNYLTTKHYLYRNFLVMIFINISVNADYRVITILDGLKKPLGNCL